MTDKEKLNKLMSAIELVIWHSSWSTRKSNRQIETFRSVDENAYSSLYNVYKKIKETLR